MLGICPVTFDQPLFIKASEIVIASPDLTKVCIRLGDIHLLYNVDVGPTLHTNTSLGSCRFHIPIQSVCLQASDQAGSTTRVTGFELLTHRCRSSIYELVVI